MPNRFNKLPVIQARKLGQYCRCVNFVNFNIHTQFCIDHKKSKVNIQKMFFAILNNVTIANGF